MHALNGANQAGVETPSTAAAWTTSEIVGQPKGTVATNEHAMVASCGKPSDEKSMMSTAFLMTTWVDRV